MRFTIDDKLLIKWMWVKQNYVEKRLLKIFWRKMKSWWSKDTYQTTMALGGAHVPPTKLFPRLAVNKTILKPRVAAIPVRGIFPT